MTTTPYRSSDIDSATEVIPAVPSFPAVPAQRVAPSVEDYQVMTVGEAAGARMWQRGQAPTPTVAPARATGPTAAPSLGTGPTAAPSRGTGPAATRVAPASPAPAPLPAAEPWPTTLSRREAKQAAPTRRRRWPWLTGGLVVGLLLGVAIGQGMGGDAATATAPTTATAPSPATVAAPAPESVPVDAPAPAAPAQPAGPETTVSDGTYEVGVDMAAGRYKTDGPSAGSMTGMCYWQRSSNDSGEFDAIIANEIVQGPGSVTVKSGEFATLSGDCTWTKV